MSTLKEPPPVKLFTSVLFNSNPDLGELQNKLTEEFGPVDFTSDRFDFTQTRYYEKEMGAGLERIIFGFRDLIRREEIVRIKIRSNRIEKLFSDGQGNRSVNIDPGYIAAEHLILATGKGFYHRPYLGRGVYADLTLVYQNNNFKPLEWTYPDYMLDDVQKVFYKLRDDYLEKLNRGNLL